MADTGKKPGKKQTKGTPPTAASAPTVTNNTDKAAKGELVPLNFAVPAEFKKDFKLFATMSDITMVDLLKKSFEFYKENKGG